METDGFGPLIDQAENILTPDSDLCSGCGRCVAACTRHLLTLEVKGFRKTATRHSVTRCSSCGRCVESCAVNAISTDGFI